MKETQNKPQGPNPKSRTLMEKHRSQVLLVYTNKTDSEVWTAFKKGEESAFNFIYRKYVPGLYNYGYQLCRDQDLVKDCVQTIFIDLRKKRSKLSDVRSIKGYLYTIMYRELFKLIKSKKEDPFEPIEANDRFFPIEVSHETKMIRSEFTAERKRKLDKALNQLPVRQKQALLLLYHEGLSYQEIAAIMEIKEVKTARKLVYRALASMREYFKIS
ncbi:RNA polymerase sigma factor [Echinicola jeungdonensis]|uniref:RNA polymerase sigma factor n=1 Tax=Echinicola jeungdonensis TaxID=709343 RepID=A0ABV5J368_9BACT|nr:RNA polymerase sigma factor [Echinicola jeungdonensis]MDN3668927.1 RNA polymerase sigma factor [Echinicola jeungdonensis]